MKRNFAPITLAFILATRAFAQEGETPAQIASALKQISPHVAPAGEREQLRGMLGRTLREQIAVANRTSSDLWATVHTRADWERTRQEKLRLLRNSLGTLPPRPEKPPTLVTARIQGDGFQIQNLVFESRPGLIVTANLYVPDPPRPSMPGIVISHSHHNPKEQGELQDLGMTWARGGCYVLVPDHLGHGERRQHPFVTAADYGGQFQVGRQDYYFRYDTSLQLYLLGETLMGWMVHDLMTGVDQLLTQPGIDSQRIILLGAVAGGGDPAGVTGAVDERIACVVPFNFGGPQPESRYPLPNDAETSFNYAGSGSWESTRDLYRSAADGFLPWVIVGSIAPRHLIHAHEFSWDRERDPVWKRFQKIWGLHDVADRLAFAHGHGTLTGQDPPGSHCNNIGVVHRRQIHEAFRRWFAIDVKPEDEYSARRRREELICLTDEARRQFKPKALHEILASLADENLSRVRTGDANLVPDERRKVVKERWTRLLGNIESPQTIAAREGSPPSEQVGGLAIRRELLDVEPGITVPVMVCSSRKHNEGGPRPLVIHIATDGIAGMLSRNADKIAASLAEGNVIALVEVRGTGASSPGTDHGQQGAITGHSATSLMLGQPLVAGQLRDLRAALRHVFTLPSIDRAKTSVCGDSPVRSLPEAAKFSYPRRIDNRPPECLPQGAILALLLALFEDDVASVEAAGGLASFRSVLGSQFVQVPHACIIPGLLREGDLPDVVAALAPKQVLLSGLDDGRGRLAARSPAQQALLANITIDGRFDDWSSIPSHTDPQGDTHDTDHKQPYDRPERVDHPDADLLEFKVTHDNENLYFYIRARGEIGRTQRAENDKPAGRYYALVTIDVDQNDETGYWLHEGGYYPTSRGYDVNAEVEFFGGEVNTGHYLNHGARNEVELAQAFLDQTAGKYTKGNDGPYPAGFMRCLPGTYKYYTQWSYHDNGTITIVRDKGPAVPGVMRIERSADGHELEVSVPMRGFLKDERGKPIIGPGSVLDLSFSLEASGELAPGRAWASDTAEPIKGYVVSPR